MRNGEERKQDKEEKESKKAEKRNSWGKRDDGP